MPGEHDSKVTTDAARVYVISRALSLAVEKSMFSRARRDATLVCFCDTAGRLPDRHMEAIRILQLHRAVCFTFMGVRRRNRIMLESQFWSMQELRRSTEREVRHPPGSLDDEIDSLYVQLRDLASAEPNGNVRERRRAVLDLLRSKQADRWSEIRTIFDENRQLASGTGYAALDKARELLDGMADSSSNDDPSGEPDR
jgi:hypothetical protein